MSKYQHHPNVLSPQATRLYEVILKCLGDSDAACWLSSEDAARQAYLAVEELEAAQLELFRGGHVNIRHGDKQSKYKLVLPEKQIRRDPHARIGQHKKPIGMHGVGRTYSGEGWTVRKETERQYKESAK